MSPEPVAKTTLDREDALVRGRELVVKIRALLQKTRKWDESRHPRDAKGQGAKAGHYADPGEIRQSPGYREGLLIEAAIRFAARNPQNTNAFGQALMELGGLTTEALEDVLGKELA